MITDKQLHKARLVVTNWLSYSNYKKDEVRVIKKLGSLEILIAQACMEARNEGIDHAAAVCDMFSSGKNIPDYAKLAANALMIGIRALKNVKEVRL